MTNSSQTDLVSELPRSDGRPSATVTAGSVTLPPPPAAFRYGAAGLSVAASFLVRWLLDPILQDTATCLPFILAIILSGWYGGLGPAVLATVLGAWTTFYVFLPPRLSFTPYTARGVAVVGIYLLTGVGMSVFFGQLHRARRRAGGEAAERRATEGQLVQTLREKGEALALLETSLKASPIGFAFLDPQLRYVRVNQALASVNGLPIEAHVGRTPRELFGEAALPVEALLQEVLESGHAILHYEGSGETHAPVGLQHYLANFYPVSTPTGQLLGVGAAVVNITARKRMEEHLQASLREKEVLLKEVHHRVKNNLQVISSLLSLQSDTVQDPAFRELFHQSERRIRAMALIHEILYRESDVARFSLAGYVQTLHAQLLDAYGVNPDRIALHIQIDDVDLPTEAAMPCGLILHELISNCLKHAFPGGHAGEVTVTATEDADRATLTVRDNGCGFPAHLEFRRAESLGLQLIRALTEQLEGTLTLESRSGTAFTLTFPLTHAQRHGATAVSGSAG